ncbi:MAG: FAD:protein FMN transferase, partial [Acidobacteriota bacterium]
APHGIGALNRAAGGDAIVLAPELIPLLQRALAFCLWSDSSWSPLGGHVYAQWERLEGGVEVDPVRFDQALRGAACELVRIDIDPEGGDTRVALAAGSRVDLRAMAQGFAVDRAVETLTAAGASNLWVETPRVVRGLGGGAAGRGWYFEPPTFPGQQRSIEAVYLRDRSVAWVSTNDPTPRGDMRTGSLASGTVAVLVSTPGAADAQAVAASLFVLSHYVGQRRLGQLDPKPAVLWMLGEGDGPPLESSYQWTKISRP